MFQHHSYRSFQGFTCLLQISTREKDYVVDTLLLRHKLYVLNEVFTHPNIVKVNIHFPKIHFFYRLKFYAYLGYCRAKVKVLHIVCSVYQRQFIFLITTLWDKGSCDKSLYVVHCQSLSMSIQFDVQITTNIN